jgi:hypothetical protein
MGLFMWDDASGCGCLKFVHDLYGFPGAPGHSHNRKVTMGFKGEVSGVDICTMAFNQDQLEITDGVIVPGTLESL